MELITRARSKRSCNNIINNVIGDCINQTFILSCIPLIDTPLLLDSFRNLFLIVMLIKENCIHCIDRLQSARCKLLNRKCPEGFNCSLNIYTIAIDVCSTRNIMGDCSVNVSILSGVQCNIVVGRSLNRTLSLQQLVDCLVREHLGIVQSIQSSRELVLNVKNLLIRINVSLKSDYSIGVTTSQKVGDKCLNQLLNVSDALITPIDATTRIFKCLIRDIVDFVSEICVKSTCGFFSDVVLILPECIASINKSVSSRSKNCIHLVKHRIDCCLNISTLTNSNNRIGKCAGEGVCVVTTRDNCASSCRNESVFVLSRRCSNTNVNANRSRSYAMNLQSSIICRVGSTGISVGASVVVRRACECQRVGSKFDACTNRQRMRTDSQLQVTSCSIVISIAYIITDDR